MDSQVTTDEWLPLSRAAARLNVHPTTLRRWADNGDIPVMLTPGGHRRFALNDLLQFAGERRVRQESKNVGQIWADRALTQTRRELVTHHDDRWLARFDDEARSRHRLLGQQLMGLTLRYLSDEDGSELLHQARDVGREYAAIAISNGMPVSQALRAAMFFRDALVEAAMDLPEDVHVRPAASMKLLRRINTLLNTVHLAIAEVYDAAYADRLPGA